MHFLLNIHKVRKGRFEDANVKFTSQTLHLPQNHPFEIFLFLNEKSAWRQSFNQNDIYNMKINNNIILKI